MQFTAEIKGLPFFLSALYEAPHSIVLPILERAVIASSLVLAKNTNASTVPVRTGFLVNHFQWVQTTLKGWWYPTALYARMVEEGTRPHVITARNARALYWPGAQHPVKSVNHPGTRPNPYMERILAASQPGIDLQFDRAMTAMVKALSY